MSSLAHASRVLTVFLAALSAAACATVTRGSNQAWTVATEPAGAVAESSDGHTCPSTPCTWKLRRKSSFHVTITKPDYQTAEADITPKVTTAGGTAFAGNVLIGGLIGMGVDAGTGAMLDLSPSPLMVRLEPRRFATANAPASQAWRPASATSASASAQGSAAVGRIYIYDLWIEPQAAQQLKVAAMTIRGVEQAGVDPTPSGAQTLMVAVGPTYANTARLEIERLLGDFTGEFHRVQ